MNLSLVIPKAVLRDVEAVAKLISGLKKPLAYTSFPTHFTVTGPYSDVADLRLEVQAYVKASSELPKHREDCLMVLASGQCGRVGFSYILRNRDELESDIAVTYDSGIVYLVGTRQNVEAFLTEIAVRECFVNVDEIAASILDLN